MTGLERRRLKLYPLALGIGLVVLGLSALGVAGAFLAPSLAARASLGRLNSETQLPLEHLVQLPNSTQSTAAEEPSYRVTVEASPEPTAQAGPHSTSTPESSDSRLEPTAPATCATGCAPSAGAFWQPDSLSSNGSAETATTSEPTPAPALATVAPSPTPTPLPNGFREFRIPESSLGIVVSPTVPPDVEANAYGVPLSQQKDESLTIWARPAAEVLGTPGLAPPQASRIVIPAIGVGSSVVESKVVKDGGVLVWQRPAWSVGYHAGTARPGSPGNMVLSGHISSPVRGEGAVFNRLPQLADLVREQQLVDVIVYAGDKKYLYRITKTSVVTPVDIGAAFADTADATLTLITCVPDRVYSHRLLVMGRLVGVAPAN